MKRGSTAEATAEMMPLGQEDVNLKELLFPIVKHLNPRTEAEKLG
jgi:hypothetical protein